MKRKNFTITAVMVILGLSLNACGDSPVEHFDVTWTEVGDTTFGNSMIQSITYCGNMFFAVGGNYLQSKMAYSADGINWMAVSSDTFDTAIYGIAYSSSSHIFVAVGHDGKMFWSSSGAIWTKVSDTKFETGAGNSIYAIAYGGGKFVAIGYDHSIGKNKIVYSTNGTTWTQVEIDIFGNANSLTITYGGDKFVALYGYSKMAYSNNGIDWTEVSDTTFGDTSIYEIVYGGNKFVAVGGGKMAYSYDGIIWYAVVDSPGGSVAYGGGKFVTVGYGEIAYSYDGITWTALTSNNPLIEYFFSVAYGADKFVAVGNMGEWPNGVGKIYYLSLP